MRIGRSIQRGLPEFLGSFPLPLVNQKWLSLSPVGSPARVDPLLSANLGNVKCRF